MLNGKTVFITGGTGSFGKTAVRTILARYQPKKLIVFSRDELKQFEMSHQFDAPHIRYFLGDVRDQSRLVEAMQGVDYVIHAAALKQVPAAEYNPMECLKTNVDGAENVIKAALACGVEKVIALSTDKAANPINLYGASKLVSDKLFTAANYWAGGYKTRFSVVRYGNVVGSRGSVLPFFRKLLAEGATELPVTDARMTRFWITLDQGIEFVLKGFERMQGGEVFIPKIPSMRITDLVESLAPGLPINVVGIRPGEKIHEILCPADSAMHTIEFHDHYVIKPTVEFSDTIDYAHNPLGEAGTVVPDGFEYNSGNNPEFLTVDQLKALNHL